MKRFSLGIETLESRTLPATFGVPWTDPQITLSFTPDGTLNGNAVSNLFSAFNQLASENEWKHEILRAFHTWTRSANIDFSVTDDAGLPLGTLGRWQGDPRFGDVRIAGTTLSANVFATATPSDPGLAGTRAGDVVLNTSIPFNGQPYDLFSVMLHEVGHSLGLPNSTNPNAVMFSQYSGLKTDLDPSDIAAIQALYGPRVADSLEGPSGNDTTATARDLGGIPLTASNAIQLVRADLTHGTDRDIYSFLSPGSGPDDDQNIVVKLQTEGISLLAARITVYSLDSGGNVVEHGNATINPDSSTGGSVSLTYDGDDENGSKRFFIRVESAENALFDIGRYALAISSEDDDVNFTQVDLESIIGGPRPVFVNSDASVNNTLATATILTPRSVSTVLPQSRFEVEASISIANDLDYYRVSAPAGSGPRFLTVSVLNLDAVDAAPTIEIFSAAGVPLTTSVIANMTGLRTVQVGGLTANAAYFVKSSSPAVGSYRLTADFTTQPTNVKTYASSQLSPTTNSQTRTLSFSRTSVATFLLTASAPNAPQGTALRLTIRDASGNTLTTITALAGDTLSTPALFLRPGTYRLTIEALRPAEFTGAIHYTLRGNVIDDPIGVQPTDPTMQPTRRPRLSMQGNLADKLDNRLFGWLALLVS